MHNNLVKTNNGSILTTFNKKEGKVLVSIASWANDDVYVQLNIDWKKLGIDPTKVTITAPEVNNFQTLKTFQLKE